jgi:hypothetical protein
MEFDSISKEVWRSSGFKIVRPLYILIFYFQPNKISIKPKKSEEVRYAFQFFQMATADICNVVLA